MKSTLVKRFAAKVAMVFALVLTSLTNTFASGWPELLDKRTNDGPHTSFYVVTVLIVLIGVIIAVVTSREGKEEKQ